LWGSLWSSCPDCFVSEYVCPNCRAPLIASARDLQCRSCDRSFPVGDGIADFSEGRSYDSFSPGQPLSAVEREGLENEIPGAAARITDYYQRILEGSLDRRGRPLRVLDSGCGNGLSVDLLCDAGFDAWGTDFSALRRWQWRERRHRDRLSMADGMRLPFADGFFDAVLCSGVLEHVGVAESRDGGYSVRALPDRDAARTAFLAEHVRILAPRGRILLDFPNGAFPIDFWHGPRPGAARWHRRDEGFLPTASDVRRYAGGLRGGLDVRALSSRGRLRFRQVGRHWWGRLLAPFASAWLAAVDVRGLALLRESSLNPFLVLELRRREDGRGDGR